jgi:hypothetical protein
MSISRSVTADFIDMRNLCFFFHPHTGPFDNSSRDSECCTGRVGKVSNSANVHTKPYRMRATPAVIVSAEFRFRTYTTLPNERSNLPTNQSPTPIDRTIALLCCRTLPRAIQLQKVTQFRCGRCFPILTSPSRNQSSSTTKNKPLKYCLRLPNSSNTRRLLQRYVLGSCGAIHLEYILSNVSFLLVA